MVPSSCNNHAYAQLGWLPSLMNLQSGFGEAPSCLGDNCQSCSEEKQIVEEKDRLQHIRHDLCRQLLVRHPPPPPLPFFLHSDPWSLAHPHGCASFWINKHLVLSMAAEPSSAMLVVGDTGYRMGLISSLLSWFSRIQVIVRG